MRVKEGDVIGTKDERYGEITFLITQDRFLVKDNVTGEEFWTTIGNVASIV